MTSSCGSARLPAKQRILVIKLGALGDFIQASGPFAAIRAYHADAHITLLTTTPFVDFAKSSPWFDEVWIDTRPKLKQVMKWLALGHRFRAGRFARVYDLQTSDRSGFYYRLFWPKRPEWSGIAIGASHPHANPQRDFMHTIERQKEQLAVAGITQVREPDYMWIPNLGDKFGLPRPFALLVPGGARHRPDKRWPIERYAALAARLAARGLTPVVLGAADEKSLAAAIRAVAPESLDLTGRTSIADLFALARDATVAIGNDTGPMHAAGQIGCAAVVLFSAASDPALCAPRGRGVVVLRSPDMTDLDLDDVLAATPS
jgi:ADP-heptose:LPS heptosyltransferase